MQRYENDERGYLRWLRLNPHGYVLNVLRTHSHHGVMLHRSTCYTIQNEAFRGSGWTTGSYAKVSSNAREPLRQWALRNVGMLPPDCLKCRP